MNIPVNSISIKFKFRKDVDDLTTLKQSIEKHGLLNPIIVNKKNELVCGYRRLMCIKELGWEQVDARVIDVSDRLSMINLCMSENVYRKDFSVDEIMYITKIQKKIQNPNIFLKLLQKIKNFFANIFHKDKTKNIEK